MSEVELREIDHSYGKSQVLRGLSLRISSGDYVVILGPSGCGKTTCLRLIAGLLRPNRGSVLIGGRGVDDIPPRKRDVAMVFQNDSLYPHLTIGKSIAFALGKGTAASEISGRILEAAKLAGAADVLDRYPDQLSGGELRRAAIAKAIVRRASVRLMDEPLSALDAPLRHCLQRDLLRWHSSVEGTTLHVTHDGQEAMRMADKIAVIEQGRIVQYGKPKEIYDRPRCRSVALAIGSPPINLLKTKLDNESIRLAGGFQCTSTRAIEVGLRGESLCLLDEERPIDRPGIVLTGDILRITPIDGMWHVHARVGGDEVVAVMPTAATLEVGRQCRFFAEAQQLHLFDAGSGDRIEAEPAD